VAIFEFCFALTIACLGIYHWATPSDAIYPPDLSAQLVMTGLSTSLVTALTVIAFWPDKRGRLTKRMIIVLSVPALYMLLQSIATISSIISAFAVQSADVNGFYIAEIVLCVLLGFFIPIALYPASEACIPFEKQRHSGIRAIMLMLNTIVGAIMVIYLRFSIYSVHENFDIKFNPIVSTISIATTSMMFIISLGSYFAIGRGIRAHMIPYVVVGIVALIIFLANTTPYVAWINAYVTDDWHDDAYVAMFALNCISILGLAIMVPLSITFAYL